MEPRAAIGSYDTGSDHYTLYTTSQNPHVARLVISAFHGLAPEHKLRVIAPDVGGGFGSKIFIYAEEVACVWASKKIGGRPIKWTAERSESFLADAHGRDHVTHAELATDASGRITGMKVRTTAAMGAYLSTFSSCVPTYLYATLLSGQYAIPNIYAEVDAVYTNTAPVDAYRGAGRPEATYVVERIVETAARELRIDPAEFRRRNFVQSFPHQTPVIMCYDAGDYGASLDKALEMADYKGFGARKAASARNGKLRGIGFSAYIEACGIAPSAAIGSLGAGVGLWESAEVRVNPVGIVEILTGSHSHGQGHETTFAQLVSDRLGVDINNVSIVHGDTDKVQFGMGTYGSRSGAVGMTAISKALDKIEAKAKRVAAAVMEASADDVDFKDGTFTVKGTDKKMAFGEVALSAYVAHKFNSAEIEPGLKESAFHDPSNFVFPAGVHICEVEVDADTGVTEVASYTAVDDFGNVINPMIVEGQVHGGIVQGIGQALAEGCVYDPEFGSTADRFLHGLSDAARRQRAELQARLHLHAVPQQSAGHEGLRRSRRHRLARRRDERGDRCAGGSRRGHAGNAAHRMESHAAHEEGCGIRQGENTMESFNYHRPAKVADAVKAMKKAKDGKYLSGGHTLIPAMKQGLAAPTDIIDLSGLKSAGVKVGGKSVTIGAGTTHAEVAGDKGRQKGDLRPVVAGRRHR